MLLDVGDHGGASLGVHGHQVLHVVVVAQVQAVHQVTDLAPVVLAHALVGGLQGQGVAQLGLDGLVLGVLHPPEFIHVQLFLLLILVRLFSFLRFDFFLQFVNFSADLHELSLRLVVITFAFEKDFVLVLEIKQTSHHIALDLLTSKFALKLQILVRLSPRLCVNLSKPVCAGTGHR